LPCAVWISICRSFATICSALQFFRFAISGSLGSDQISQSTRFKISQSGHISAHSTPVGDRASNRRRSGRSGASDRPSAPTLGITQFVPPQRLSSPRSASIRLTKATAASLRGFKGLRQDLAVCRSLPKIRSLDSKRDGSSLPSRLFSHNGMIVGPASTRNTIVLRMIRLRIKHFAGGYAKREQLRPYEARNNVTNVRPFAQAANEAACDVHLVSTAERRRHRLEHRKDGTWRRQ
jgi:hypothetical protein